MQFQNTQNSYAATAKEGACWETVCLLQANLNTPNHTHTDTKNQTKKKPNISSTTYSYIHLYPPNTNKQAFERTPAFLTSNALHSTSVLPSLCGAAWALLCMCVCVCVCVYPHTEWSRWVGKLWRASSKLLILDRMWARCGLSRIRLVGLQLGTRSGQGQGQSCPRVRGHPGSEVTDAVRIPICIKLLSRGKAMEYSMFKLRSV